MAQFRPEPGFPTTRMRRLRYNPAVRQLAREVQLAPGDLVLPLFARTGNDVRQPIGSMPGNFQLSVDGIAAEAKEAARLGLGGIILFGIPAEKDAHGSDSYSDNGIIQQAIKAAKDAAPELLVITDVCFCEYTDHGHCGVLVDGDVDNDKTVPLLVREAIAYADAGADVVAPSDMMDGRVGAIRTALDDAGHTRVSILSYAVKYASAFYGPFREAAQSAPKQGDRRGYQMDPANVREALRMARRDVAEGADWILVKPALAYLDVIRVVREAVDVPVVAYNVSGEYSMLKAAAANGWIDGERAMLEALTSIKRAGAQRIVTYHALEAAALLAEV